MNTIITFLIGTKQYIEANLFASLLAAIYSFIGSYVYNDPLAIGVLVMAYFFDFITALYKCRVNKVQIKSSLLPRFIYHLVFICALLSFSWHLSQTNLLFYFLPSVIYGGCMSQQLLSILENLNEAKVIDVNFFKYYRQVILNRYVRSSETKKIDDDTVVLDGVETKPKSNDIPIQPEITDLHNT